MSFLTLTDVSKFYGPNCVVANMNLSVEKGEFVTLLGPSGCGKTTTLQMIAGFTEVSQGWKTSTHDVKYDQHTCGGLCFNLKGPITWGKRMGQPSYFFSQ